MCCMWRPGKDCSSGYTMFILQWYRWVLKDCRNLHEDPHMSVHLLGQNNMSSLWEKMPSRYSKQAKDLNRSHLGYRWQLCLLIVPPRTKPTVKALVWLHILELLNFDCTNFEGYLWEDTILEWHWRNYFF